MDKIDETVLPEGIPASAFNKILAAIHNLTLSTELTYSQAVVLMRFIAYRARVKDDPYSKSLIEQFIAMETRVGDRGYG